MIHPLHIFFNFVFFTSSLYSLWVFYVFDFLDYSDIWLCYICVGFNFVAFMDLCCFWFGKFDFLLVFIGLSWESLIFHGFILDLGLFLVGNSQISLLHSLWVTIATVPHPWSSNATKVQLLLFFLLIFYGYSFLFPWIIILELIWALVNFC